MDRNAEYRDGQAAPDKPSLFLRTPLSFSPHGAPIWRPPESEQLDYEGEIVLVIGRGGRRIPAERAHGAIAGLTAMNEGSVRDWLRHGKFNVTQGKNFDRSGGLGPWIETDLSGVRLTDMTVETRVNGEVRQRDTTASMAFPFARIVEYVSTFATLLPGDLIATGTPTGAGARFDPPRWLVPGDVVEVEVEGVGTLRNTVEDEPA
jgi:2-keto-4-pentenoate hydratase/2-oxohepta-3-ene-1,7-dioic acid hydratase in catechol pathway